VSYIVRGWKPFRLSLCVFLCRHEVVPQAARAALYCVVLVFPRIFVRWEPECGGDIPSDEGD